MSGFQGIKTGNGQIMKFTEKRRPQELVAGRIFLSLSSPD